jgi:hypothetical protein
LLRWWHSVHVEAVVIGGVAASVLGRPRLTQDIDAIARVDDSAVADFVESSRQFGFDLRTSDGVAFAQVSRVILLRHSPSLTDVDISIAGLSFEFDAIEHAVPVRTADLDVPLPRVADLIVMKAVAGRPKDLQDIEGLVAVHPNVDMTSVRTTIRQFSELLEMPEILDNFNAIVTKRA